MDNDQQIPLKFLDEAEDCCDRIESTVLGLANAIPHPPELDHALRATHSIKGGAAMMGYNPLSRVVHQLEDFLKIIRVRYHSQPIGLEVETLLLNAVDDIRLVIDLHRRGQSIDQTWLTSNSQPTFDRLRQHLGDLRIEDEDILLSQEGEIDPAILFFESGVQESLDELEEQFNQLPPEQLLLKLQTAAQELSEFGRMAQFDEFVALCQSVQDHSQQIDLAQVIPLTRQALKIWRKSHSLVQLGRGENIPSQLFGWPLAQPPDSTLSSNDAFDRKSNDPSEFLGTIFSAEDLLNTQSTRLYELIDIESVDLDLPLLPLETDDQLELINEHDFSVEFDHIPGFCAIVNSDPADWEEPLEIVSELAKIELPDFPTNHAFDEENLEPSLALDLEFGNFNIPDFPLANYTSGEDPEPSLLGSELAKIELQDLDSQLIVPIVTNALQAQDNNSLQEVPTVRVPVEYLQQFNTVFGKLILERNAINLRLVEIQNYTKLLRQRIKTLESSHQEIRQRPATISETPPLPTTISPNDFDALEMDLYNDLDLVSQDQMETIVQLAEVTSDIEFSVREMTQSLRSLNQTTLDLQTNVVQTQMIPFAEVVKRFPRLIRDLSVQFGKTVNLTILGEKTGIDRSIIEKLHPALLQLLRNAFDHGIEDSATRTAAGKPAAGNIILAASRRGSDTIITIQDDGSGINVDLIRQRLQQIGLPATDVSEMSETQLLDIIFEPGFSTKANRTELSGHGIGMDLVRNNIEQVRGHIRVKTQPGEGTTVIIRVPFALSILRVMLLERAGFIFAVSVDGVREIIHLQPELLRDRGTKILWQAQTIPVLSIEQGIHFKRSYRPFSLPITPTITQPTVLVVGEDQTSIAFHIDRFWGEKEVTLRSIDSPMPLTPGFGNSIILGDGRVIPLVDLMQFASWMFDTNRAINHTTADQVNHSVATNGIAMRPENAVDAYLPAVSQKLSDTILVIDDSINVRRYLALMLEKEGYQVEQARDGQEAVDKLYAGLVVQGVLCDIEMPRLDGYGVLDSLRSNEVFADLPIVMLSSRSSEKHRQLAMNLGASGYFTKPYTEPELLGSLKSLIAAAP